MRLSEAMRLDGQVAVITGGSSGLGAASAKRLAELGAEVLVVARREGPLAEVVDAIRTAGGRASWLAADISQQSAAADVTAAATRLGPVRVLVNSAGAVSALPASRETAAQFRSIIDLNLLGTYWMCQAVGTVMPPGGSIINVSSVLGLVSVGLPQAAYASSKAGLLGLTRDLAVQWASRRGIRVNAICPGYFRSAMLDELDPAQLETILTRVPMGRIGEVEEIANMVAFLGTDASSYVTGATLVLDGGLTIR